jgi:hypothetical protein
VDGEINDSMFSSEHEQRNGDRHAWLDLNMKKDIEYDWIVGHSIQGNTTQGEPGTSNCFSFMKPTV